MCIANRARVVYSRISCSHIALLSQRHAQSAQLRMSEQCLQNCTKNAFKTLPTKLNFLAGTGMHMGHTHMDVCVKFGRASTKSAVNCRAFYNISKPNASPRIGPARLFDRNSNIRILQSLNPSRNNEKQIHVLRGLAMHSRKNVYEPTLSRRCIAISFRREIR